MSHSNTQAATNSIRSYTTSKTSNLNMHNTSPATALAYQHFQMPTLQFHAQPQFMRQNIIPGAPLVLYVYGFAPGTSEEQFKQDFFKPFEDVVPKIDWESECLKIDYKGDKIISFVHVQSRDSAEKVIRYWNGRKMGISKIGLQVRIKGENMHQKPKEPNVFVYGFPRNMEKQEFEDTFFGAEFQDIKNGVEKLDYLPEKLQAFIHCASVHDCEQLIKAWDGRTLGDNTKPLQVRFKGDDPNANKIAPVLYVFGFPKGMLEAEFRDEFFKSNPSFEQKIDFHQAKLYAFIHCHNTAQCQDLINTWHGKLFQSSTKPLQVRFRDHHGSPNGGVLNAQLNGQINNSHPHGGQQNVNINAQQQNQVQNQHSQQQHQQNQQNHHHQQQQHHHQQQLRQQVPQLPGFQQVAAAVQQQQLIRQIQPQALSNFGVQPYFLPVNLANQINVQYPYLSPHPAFYQQQDPNTYIQPHNSNKRSAHHNNQMSLENSDNLIRFLEQNNLVEQQQLLNSQLLNVQLAKHHEHQLHPEAVHNSQNTAIRQTQKQVKTTAQIPTQISTISASNPKQLHTTRPTQTIKLPTVTTTNSSFPTGLSSKMPKIMKS